MAADVAWFEYELLVVGVGPTIRETWPSTCPEGHPLGKGRMIVGWNPHPDPAVSEMVRTWECRSCGAKTYGAHSETVD